MFHFPHISYGHFWKSTGSGRIYNTESAGMIYILFPTKLTPTEVLCQNGPLLWLHLLILSVKAIKHPSPLFLEL